jgi:hypothetical protein
VELCLGRGVKGAGVGRDGYPETSLKRCETPRTRVIETSSFSCRKHSDPNGSRETRRLVLRYAEEDDHESRIAA